MTENIYKKGKVWYYDIVSNGEVITVTGKTKEEVLDKMDCYAFGDAPDVNFVKAIADFFLYTILLVLDFILIWVNLFLIYDYL